ncbi:unnamed protein product [Mytilus coruscus]|uniref:C1q domain-containing protein n=1 Tax=Mytilus coruscus TaxID=42192 RepID=A0A6J8ENE8_MYTCO|nr:unnamed protein product [Mytilus coruscus]
MAFMVLHGCAIFICIISLNKNVIANSCENDNCKAAIDLPLITKLNAPLKAELDISGFTSQLKELIGNEVKKAVSVAMKDLAENIVDKRTQSALENLQTYNNRTISSFLQEMEVKMETNQNITAKKIHSLNSEDIKLEKIIEQMKENQMKKISSIESKVTKNSERVAMTAFVPADTSRLSVGSVVKFSDIKFNVGIGALSSFKHTGNLCVKKVVYKFNGVFEQMMVKQMSTESKLSLHETVVTSTNEKVAISAFVSTDLYLEIGSVIMFTDVEFSVEIANLSTFNDTGKFECEGGGLYIVSVSIEIKHYQGEFHIYVNGKVFSKPVKHSYDNWYQSSSAVKAVELNKNDNVWVQIAGPGTNVIFQSPRVASAQKTVLRY